MLDGGLKNQLQHPGARRGWSNWGKAKALSNGSDTALVVTHGQAGMNSWHGRIEHLDENPRAAELQLSTGDLREIDAAFSKIDLKGAQGQRRSIRRSTMKVVLAAADRQQGAKAVKVANEESS